MSNINPNILEEHWGKLLLPNGEMPRGKIDLFVDGVTHPYEAILSIQSHPSDKILFSTVLIISDLQTSEPYTRNQLRVRLPATYQSAIAKNNSPGRRHLYGLSLPSNFFSPYQPPVQLRVD